MATIWIKHHCSGFVLDCGVGWEFVFIVFEFVGPRQIVEPICDGGLERPRSKEHQAEFVPEKIKAGCSSIRQ